MDVFGAVTPCGKEQGKPKNPYVVGSNPSFYFFCFDSP